MNKRNKRLLGWIVPHSFAVAWGERRFRNQRRIRSENLLKLYAMSQQLNNGRRFDYAEAEDFLVDLGCDRDVVREASIPEDSLIACTSAIAESNPQDRVIGLHVGNFVGMSLAFLTAAIRELRSDSFLVAIDPAIPHRGIADPASKTLALLDHFGLLDSVLMVTGFSLEKNPSQDGIPFAGYDPVEHFHSELACENQLGHIIGLAPESFDFALVDGNHDHTYLDRELRSIDGLLRVGGLLILDDVSAHWRDIQDLYHSIDTEGYMRVLSDGRIGILQKRSAVLAGRNASRIDRSESA